MKLIRYIKFAVAIIFFELMLGRICYEFGAAQNYFVQGIWSMYLFVLYTLIYIVICLCQGWGETSLGTNIFSTAFLGVPFIASLIVIGLSEPHEVELPFAVTLLVIFGIAFLLEACILTLQVIRNNVIRKGYKKVSSQ